MKSKQTLKIGQQYRVIEDSHNACRKGTIITVDDIFSDGWFYDDKTQLGFNQKHDKLQLLPKKQLLKNQKKEVKKWKYSREEIVRKYNLGQTMWQQVLKDDLLAKEPNPTPKKKSFDLGENSKCLKCNKQLCTCGRDSFGSFPITKKKSKDIKQEDKKIPKGTILKIEATSSINPVLCLKNKQEDKKECKHKRTGEEDGWYCYFCKDWVEWKKEKCPKCGNCFPLCQRTESPSLLNDIETIEEIFPVSSKDGLSYYNSKREIVNKINEIITKLNKRIL